MRLSISWKHHERQHHAKEKDRMEEETEGGRATTWARHDSTEIHEMEDFIHDFEGFRVRT